MDSPLHSTPAAGPAADARKSSMCSATCDTLSLADWRPPDLPRTNTQFQDGFIGLFRSLGREGRSDLELARSAILIYSSARAFRACDSPSGRPHFELDPPPPWCMTGPFSGPFPRPLFAPATSPQAYRSGPLHANTGRTSVTRCTICGVASGSALWSFNAHTSDGGLLVESWWTGRLMTAPQGTELSGTCQMQMQLHTERHCIPQTDQ